MNCESINYSFVFRLNLFFLFLLLHVVCFAQWQPDQRLTNNPFASTTSQNNSHCIAASGDTVHIVWYDNRDGHSEIYYKRSVDAGLNWSNDTRLTYDSVASEEPSIISEGLMVHLVWHKILSSGNYRVYYKHSTNGGQSWGNDIMLVNNKSYYPSISVSGNAVHVVWQSSQTFYEEIFYKHSTDGGINWDPDVRISPANSDSYSPYISVSGQNVNTVWYGGISNNYGVYYRRSTDGGVNWDLALFIADCPVNSNDPVVASSGFSVHVVWNHAISFNSEIYYKQSIDGGITWGNVTRLSFDSSSSRFPSVIATPTCIHVVWDDSRNGNYEIYYKRSTDNGMNWESETRLTNNSGYSGNPSITIYSSVVHVVWNDSRDGNGEIYYKRNPTGNIVGIHPVNNDISKNFNLSQNYPNPFNPSTTIKFDISPSKGDRGMSTRLVIYDLLGREVVALIDKQFQPGSYSASWDASNFPSGVYFYKLESGDFNQSKKMVLIK